MDNIYNNSGIAFVADAISVSLNQASGVKELVSESNKFFSIGVTSCSGKTLQYVLILFTAVGKASFEFSKHVNEDAIRYILAILRKLSTLQIICFVFSFSIYRWTYD